MFGFVLCLGFVLWLKLGLPISTEGQYYIVRDCRY